MIASSLLAGLLAVQLVGGLLFEPELQQELLRAHNNVRAETYEGKMMCGGNTVCPKARQTSAPLAWDASLAKFASTHAGRCVLGHSIGSSYGENLYSKVGATQFTKASLYNAVYTKWGVEEARVWRYTTRLGRTSAGHFTQIVWQSTERVGCGYAKCTFGMFLVCSYGPKGNALTREVYRPLVYPTASPTRPPSPTKPPTPRPTKRSAPRATDDPDTYNLHSAVHSARFWGYKVTYGTSCVTFRGLAKRFPDFTNPKVTHPTFVIKPLVCTTTRTSYSNFGGIELWISGRTKLLKFSWQFKNFAFCRSDTLAGCDGNWRFRTKGSSSYSGDRFIADPTISARWGCPQNPGEFNVVSTTPASLSASSSPSVVSSLPGSTTPPASASPGSLPPTTNSLVASTAAVDHHNRNANKNAALANTDSSTNDMLPILLPVLGGVLLVIVLTAAACIYMRRRKQSAQTSQDKTTTLLNAEVDTL